MPEEGQVDTFTVAEMIELLRQMPNQASSLVVEVLNGRGKVIHRFLSVSRAGAVVAVRVVRGTGTKV